MIKILAFLLTTTILALAAYAEHPRGAEHPIKTEHPRSTEHPKQGEHPGGVTEHPKAESAKRTATVRALIFHADWCASCKALAPKLEAVKKEYGNRPIEFITLDLTNGETTAVAAATMDAHELTEIFEQNQGKTGYVALVDGKGKILAKLQADHTAAEMRTALNQSLAAAAAEKSEHPKKTEHPGRSEDPKKPEHPGRSEHPRD